MFVQEALVRDFDLIGNLYAGHDNARRGRHFIKGPVRASRLVHFQRVLRSLSF